MRLLDQDLKRLGFARLWIGETASRVGSELTRLAIPLLAITALGATPFQMGLLSAAGSLATLLFGLSVGVWADSFERRRVLLSVNMLQIVALSSVPILFWSGGLNLQFLYAVAFVTGMFSLLFDSALSAYVPSLVPPEHLVRANARLQASSGVAEVGGPGLAGVLFQAIGPAPTILVDAATYLASLAALSRLPDAPPDRDPENVERHLAAIRRGLTTVLKDPIQRSLAFAAAHFNFFTAMFFALFTLYVIRVLGFSPFLVGALSAVGGVAGFAGAAVSDALGRRFGLGKTLIAAYAVPGVVGILIPVASGVGPYWARVFLVGTAQVLWTFLVVVNVVLSETIKQALVPNALLGRVTATVRFLTWGVEPLGAVAGGALGGRILGLTPTLVGATCGVALSFLWLVRREVRGLENLDSHHVSDASRQPEGA